MRCLAANSGHTLTDQDFDLGVGLSLDAIDLEQ